LSILQVAVPNILCIVLCSRWSTASTSCMHCIKVQLPHGPVATTHSSTTKRGCGKQLELRVAMKLSLNLVAKSLYI
jgi:hypothetical protein